VPETVTTIELTAEVVASYVRNHHVSASDVPALIRTIFDAFVGEPATENAGAAVRELTKAQIRRSVTRDAIISFEDGRGYKMLSRHLAKCGLTPTGYREKWGLPHDYPMVAPTYHELRSALAKARGLGRRPAPPTAPRKARKPRPQKMPATTGREI
jgi:predicted transcriptional regulator